MQWEETISKRTGQRVLESLGRTICRRQGGGEINRQEMGHSNGMAGREGGGAGLGSGEQLGAALPPRGFELRCDMQTSTREQL